MYTKPALIYAGALRDGRPQVRTATRPCSPDAQHASSPVHMTASKLPVSNRVHVRPPSRLRSLPVGPTASAVSSVRQATPERYSPGTVRATIQVRPPSRLSAAAFGAWVGVVKSPPTASP